MFLPTGQQNTQVSSTSTNSHSKSDSISSLSGITPGQWTRPSEKHIWRTIDFLHVIVMFFSLYTGTIIAILRNELFKQCPLYAKLILRENATSFATDTIDAESEWSSVYTCEFVSFAYLSSFVISFISLWIHIVFRRVVRTERLLRFPIGLLTLIFALITFIATLIVTDGVIQFCRNSSGNLCSSSGPSIFSESRWKIISLPVGGWLSTLSLSLNAFIRGIQLFSKPKKSPETLKLLLNQLTMHRKQSKIEKEVSEFSSQISRQSTDKNRAQSFNQYAMNNSYNRALPPELHSYPHPPVPQYQQIKKRSRCSRICCPCLARRKQNRRFFDEPYRPFVVPDEYFHRLEHMKSNGTAPMNTCCHHTMHHPVEQQTQTEIIVPQKSIEDITEVPFLGRRRSSVRFEDENQTAKASNEPTVVEKKMESIPIIKEEEEIQVTPLPDNPLERNVSFRNNEDDLWTTVTINAEQCVLVQSSHFNRLSLENSSHIDTSAGNIDNGVTAIQINNKTIEPILSEPVEVPIAPPPALPPVRVKPHRPTRIHHKTLPPPPPLPPPSRTLTTTSDDDCDLRNIKPVEEINAIVTDKYNYNSLSQALKSNVERLKSTFVLAQEKQSHYDRPKNIRTQIAQRSLQNFNVKDHSSDC